MFRLMDKCSEEHLTSMGSLKRRAGDSSSASSLGYSSIPRKGVSFSVLDTPEQDPLSPSVTAQLRAADALHVKLISKLTAIAVRHLPDLWHLPQERLAGMQSLAPELSNLVQDASHALADIVQDFTDSYRHAAQLTMLQDSSQSLRRNLSRSIISLPSQHSSSQ